MAAKLEHALGKAELAAILDSVMDAIIAIDTDHQIVLFNAGAEKMFGCSEADALGSSLERFIPERYRAEHRNHIRRFRESGLTTRRKGTLGKLWGLHVNGDGFPIEASIGMVAAGGRKLLSVILRDIMTKKDAEIQLQESQRKLSSLMGSLPGMAYRCLIDSAWTMQFVSEGCLALTGYGAQEFVEGRIAYGDLIHPEDRADVWSGLQAAIERQGHFHLNYRIRTRDGAVRWVSEQSVEVLPEQDDGTHLLEGIITDVTALKKAENRLRSSEEKFRQLANNAPVAIFQTNRRGDCVYVNPSWCDFAGVSAEEALGSGWFRAFHPEERERLGSEWIDLVKSGSEVLPLSDRRFVRPDGTETWLHGVAVALKGASGQVTGYLGTLTDLTARRQAAEQISESERRFRAVFNQRTELAGFVALDGILTDANERSLEMIGADKAEVVGLPFWDTPWWAHDTAQQKRLQGAVTQAASGEFVRFESEISRMDGTIAIVDFSLNPISDGDGNVQMLLAEGVDITQQKRAEEELRQSRKRVQEAEKLVSIATIAAGIAHDIGAPMTTILGYAEMMQKSLSDEKNRRRAGIIIEQLNRITGLVQALLNMARPGDQVHISIDIATVIEMSLEFYREMLSKRGIAVERGLASVPVIAGDPNRLQQAFLNLFANAADAMPDGGTLRVALDSPSPGIVEVRIGDSGAGIPADQLERIFEPFYTTKQRGQGTGLGLLVVKSIVDEHLGTIAVESSPGRGTTFTIRLPSSEE